MRSPRHKRALVMAKALQVCLGDDVQSVAALKWNVRRKYLNVTRIIDFTEVERQAGMIP